MDKNLASALLKAQASMGKLIPDSSNPGFKGSKYASLATVLETVRGPLSDAGLVLYQSATSADGMVIVWTRLIHAESGEEIAEALALPVAQQTPQAYGSAITYARRYMAMAMCGLAPDDDDGEASSAPAPRQAPSAKPAPRPANTAPKATAAGDNPFTDPDPVKVLDTLGAELYGAEWPTVRQHNIKRLTGADDAVLSADQVQKLLGGLQKLKAQRVAA